MQAIRDKDNAINLNENIEMIKQCIEHYKEAFEEFNRDRFKIALGVNVVRAIESQFNTIVPFERLKPRLFGVIVEELEDEEQADEIKVYYDIL